MLYRAEHFTTNYYLSASKHPIHGSPVSATGEGWIGVWPWKLSIPAIVLRLRLQPATAKSSATSL